MNKEQMRIAIAEACGWTKCRMAIKGVGAPERSPSPHGFPPDKNYEAPLPDYPSCLNAMATAEATLPGLTRYYKILFDVAVPPGQGILAHTAERLHVSATAEQRAEAFLKTIDKWVP